MRRGRLRIAVPAHVLRHSPAGGHGRVWHNVVRALRDLARVQVVEAGDRPRRADAWLIDGHEAPVQTDLPVVAQVHETSWVLPEVQASMDPVFLAMIEQRTVRAAACATRIVTAARATRAQIAGFLGWEEDRIDVVPHGVDVRRFRPDLPSPVRGPYVLFAATVHPRKNLASLRDAMATLAAEGFPHRLAIVAGPAPDREDSDALTAAAFAELPGAPGRIVRIERPDDDGLAALMAGAAAFVLPSLWEGFGLTALEALACGAPVIVADRGALPEVVGDAGLTAEPTAAGLAAALRRVLGDDALAARLRRAGRARAEGMTWEHAARGWLASVERARTL